MFNLIKRHKIVTNWRPILNFCKVYLDGERVAFSLDVTYYSSPGLGKLQIILKDAYHEDPISTLFKCFLSHRYSQTKRQFQDSTRSKITNAFFKIAFRKINFQKQFLKSDLSFFESCKPRYHDGDVGIELAHRAHADSICRPFRVCASCVSP